MPDKLLTCMASILNLTTIISYIILYSFHSVYKYKKQLNEIEDEAGLAVPKSTQTRDNVSHPTIPTLVFLNNYDNIMHNIIILQIQYVKHHYTLILILCM